MSKRKLKNQIAHLHREADRLSHYDGNYYDEESGASLVIPGAITKQAAQPTIVIKSTDPAVRGTKAQFDIVITRRTNTIAEALPICLFGSTHSRAGYSQFLIPPPGYSVSVMGGLNSPVAGTTNMIRFRYTDGVNTDDVDVTCNQVPYPVFLDALSADVFQISNIRYEIPDPADTIQFGMRHTFQSKSLFGKMTEDDITIGAYKRPDQYQAGIVDIPLNAKIDKETMFNMNVTDAANTYPFTFYLHTFVERFNKHDKLTAF